MLFLLTRPIVDSRFIRTQGQPVNVIGGVNFIVGNDQLRIQIDAKRKFKDRRVLCKVENDQ